MNRKELVSVLLGLALLMACGTDPDPASAGASHHPAEVHWGYGLEDGPDRWAALSPEFSLCGDGREQSPIDLSDAVPVDAEPVIRRLEKPMLTAEQRTRVLDLIDNGHTIQVSNVPSMSLHIEGEQFELVQYHFHAPSEHTIDGEHFPLEGHFVHKSAAGRLAVIGVLVEQGEKDPIFDPLIAALPTGPGDERHLEAVDLEIAAPERYYRYEGSLTTPPCSEGVSWIVIRARRKIGPAQLAKLASLLHDNNRPVQPLEGRELVLVSN